MSTIPFYILLGIISTIFIHFIALLVGLPEILRPLTWLGYLGDGMIRIYEWLGIFVGYCWYLCMYVAAWFQNVVVERFVPALKQTIIDLGTSLEKFFKVSVFFAAVRDQVYEFWQAYSTQIMQGVIAMVLLIAVIGIAYTAWKNSKKESTIPPDEDIGDDKDVSVGSKRKVKIVK
jgi:hypothetical protein